MSQDLQKKQAAMAAAKLIDDDMIIGVGTGSTVNFFICELAEKRHMIEGAVASSQQTLKLLQEKQIPVIDLNTIASVDLTIDGADEANQHRQLIKGGGAALTGEKILIANSKRFVCIIDHSKYVPTLGTFPVPIEVIPMARSYVARALVKLGGDPVYRQGVTTDYGNQILDVHNLTINSALELENEINQIPGVVTNGIFARHPADALYIAQEDHIEIIQ